MRWDKWLEGAAFSGVTMALPLAIQYLAGGTISKSELGVLASLFLTGIYAWCKQHPVSDAPSEAAAPPKP